MNADRHDPGDQLLVRPGYLAGPGDHDTALDAFHADHPSWSRHRPHDGPDTVLVSECLTGRVRLSHRPGAGIRWSVVGYDSPIGERAWSADFDRAVPHEISLAVAGTLSSALAYTGHAYEEALWGTRSTRSTLAELLADACWRDVSDERKMAFEAPDATAGIIRWDNGLFHAAPDAQDHPATVCLWGGTPVGDGAPKRWQAFFSATTPTRLITAALHHLTDPLAASRSRAQIPAAHRDLVRTSPAPLPGRTQAATRRTAPFGSTAAAGHPAVSPPTSRTARRPA
ncbi:DUF317 domain-containing protein [Kitasatospora sp. NPDC057965]|uniref:DUF317 domain-containing protein n=1 Tax=Kitasatospora sp. NPDC057965 TaxID=3346291 RepID=UPI0036DB4C54